MRRLLLLLLLLTALPLQAQQLPLSSKATASVLTCGPGNDFYVRFGHTALRICDSTQGLDVVYNYGTFDFNEPNFYLKFAGGRMNYRLERCPSALFFATYIYEQRALWETPLDLDSQQVSNLFLLLEANNRPEYRYYRYDFFRDNCATRVRDIVELVYSIPTSNRRGQSYRQYVHQSIDRTQQWWLLGVDMLLGLPADHRCNEREAMFHPMAMMQTISTQSPLPTRQLMTDTRTPLRRSFPPAVAFGLLLLAGVVCRIYSPIAARIYSRTLMIVASVVGVVLCLMWFATSHWCTQWNPNILWSLPLWLLMAIRWERSPRWSLWAMTICLAASAVWVIWSGASLALLLIIASLGVALSELWHRMPRQQRRPR